MVNFKYGNVGLDLTLAYAGASFIIALLNTAAVVRTLALDVQYCDADWAKCESVLDIFLSCSSYSGVQHKMFFESI